MLAILMIFEIQVGGRNVVGSTEMCVLGFSSGRGVAEWR